MSNDVGTLAPDEIEALAESRTVADAWGVEDVRPCIAQIYSSGAASGEGRNPHAHALVLEMDYLGLSREVIERHLRDFNTRLSPPLPVSEIKKLLKRLERPGRWPYSCKHQLLAPYCIGDGCPFKSSKGRWQASRVSANGLTVSGWLPHMKGSEVKIFLGLYRLARLKGRGPRASIPFTFRELEKHSGVGRSQIRKAIERLHELGLVGGLSISEMKGKASHFRFPPVLPPSPGTNRGKYSGSIIEQ